MPQPLWLKEMWSYEQTELLGPATLLFSVENNRIGARPLKPDTTSNFVLTAYNQLSQLNFRVKNEEKKKIRNYK